MRYLIRGEDERGQLVWHGAAMVDGKLTTTWLAQRSGAWPYSLLNAACEVLTELRMKGDAIAKYAVVVND